MSGPAVVATSARVVAVVGVILLGLAAAPVAAQPPSKDVVVTNAPGEPVPVQEVGDRAVRAFQQLIFVAVTEGAMNGTANLTIPAGTRLVIEHVSGWADVPVGQTADLFVSTNVNSVATTHILLGAGPRTVDNPTNPERFRVSQSLRLYADSGAAAQVGITRGNPHTGTATGFVTVSGYLVDLP